MNELLRFETGVEKMTASHFAAKEGFKSVLEELVHGGVDINIPTQFDCLTPLHLACQHTDNDVALSMTELLLKAGGCVNARDHYNRTPLLSACEMGNLDLVLLLLERGAEMNTSCDKEDFPVMVNWVQGYSPLLSRRLLDELSDPYEGNNALIQSCREHHFDIVLELVQRACDLNTCNMMGNTALHIACKSQSRFLYIDQRVPLRLPVIGHPEIVQVLVNAGTKLNLANKAGETAVYRALSCLLEINSLEIDDESKLECYDNTLQIVYIMIHAGCDTKFYNRIGEKSLLTLLLKSRNKHLGPFRALLEEKLYSTAWLLIAAGCRVTDHHILLDTEEINPSQTAPKAAELHVSGACNALRSKLVRTMSQDSSYSMSGASDLHILLRAHVNIPSMLKHQARMCIRKNLPQPVSQSVRRLRLPPLLHKFLSLQIL